MALGREQQQRMESMNEQISQRFFLFLTVCSGRRNPPLLSLWIEAKCFLCKCHTYGSGRVPNADYSKVLVFHLVIPIVLIFFF